MIVNEMMRIVIIVINEIVFFDMVILLYSEKGEKATKRKAKTTRSARGVYSFGRTCQK